MIKDIATDKTKDYYQIEQVMTLVQDHHDFLKHPDMEKIARTLKMSEANVHQLFTRWAGVTPDQFLQYLTVSYAKDRLADSVNTIAAAMHSGLSRPDNLSNLSVTFEEMAPGKYKIKGQGLDIRYGVHQSPFGLCLIGVTNRGICLLTFLSEGSEAKITSELRDIWPLANFIYDQANTQVYVEQIFNSAASERNRLALWLKGTSFQIKVWKALLSIPAGSLVTYSIVAQCIGANKAVRAAASAVACNPIAYLIPCHRVINSTGRMGKYACGSARKKAMIAWEQAKH